MGHFVYIVECTDGIYYTGICFDLTNRINAHNNGKYKGSFTKARRPVRLVYWEELENKFVAAKREKVIKDFSRNKKQKLIGSLRTK